MRALVQLYCASFTFDRRDNHEMVHNLIIRTQLVLFLKSTSYTLLYWFCLTEILKIMV